MFCIAAASYVGPHVGIGKANLRLYGPRRALSWYASENEKVSKVKSRMVQECVI